MADCAGEHEEVDRRQCRICLSEEDPCEALVSPCWCRGSVGLVHVTCLERWLSQTRTTCCELCLFPFRTVRTPRYRRREALRLWLHHPRHLRRLRDELLLTTVLSVTMLLLTIASMVAVQYFLDKSLASMSSGVMLGLIGFLVGSIVIFYFYTLYILLREEWAMWQSWWRGSFDVKVVLGSSDTALSRTSNQSQQDE